jgi:hypothetical protein
VVDDKLPDQAADMVAQVKQVDSLPRRRRGTAVVARARARQRRHGDLLSRSQHGARRDLVIDGMPVMDYPGGGSATEFIATIDNLLKLDFDTMIPGHGKLMTKDNVRASCTRFQTMNDRTRLDPIGV